VVPNSGLLREWIHNSARVKQRWVRLNFAVSYDTSTEKLVAIPRIVEEAVNSTPNTRFDRAHFKEYGEFGLIFGVAFFVQSPKYQDMMDARQAFNMELKRRFKKEGISFACPAGFTCAGRRRA